MKHLSMNEACEKESETSIDELGGVGLPTFRIDQYTNIFCFYIRVKDEKQSERVDKQRKYARLEKLQTHRELMKQLSLQKKNMLIKHRILAREKLT